MFSKWDYLKGDQRIVVLSVGGTTTLSFDKPGKTEREIKEIEKVLNGIANKEFGVYGSGIDPSISGTARYLNARVERIV